MSTKNANVEKAANAMLSIAVNGISVNHHFADEYARQLDAAGLLVTPEMTACVEACKVYALTFNKVFGADGPLQDNNDYHNIIGAGRAILAQEAARKPVQSWTAEGAELWLNARYNSTLPDHRAAAACAAVLNAINAEAREQRS